MGQKRGILMASVLTVLLAMMLSCGQADVRLGWVETSAQSQVKATYTEFTGKETRTVRAEPGTILYLEYDAQVNKGALHLEVDDPYGETVWCVSLCEDCGGTKTLPVAWAGCYTISVRGEGTGGGFDLKWDQKKFG